VKIRPNIRPNDGRAFGIKKSGRERSIVSQGVLACSVPATTQSGPVSNALGVWYSHAAAQPASAPEPRVEPVVMPEIAGQNRENPFRILQSRHGNSRNARENVSESNRRPSIGIPQLAKIGDQVIGR
jgi:hypothetical protein